MSAETLLVIFVGVTAVAFTAQCISVWQASRTIREIAQRLERRSQEVEGKLRVVQDRLLEVSQELKPLQDAAANVSRNVDEMSSTIRQRAEDIDLFVGELMTVGREQASKIDYLVTDTVRKFEQTTEVIQKDVLKPAVEISSFVKGVRTGLNVLFSREDEGPEKRVQEEELFI